MDQQEILTLFDKEQRIEIEFPDMEKQIFPHLIRFVRPAPGMSFILYSDLDEADLDAAIQEQIGYFSQRQQPFEWKVYDLSQRLRRLRRGRTGRRRLDLLPSR